ncbi:MAG: fumarylacetoacetate hydrolase family protein [Planctomycetes bacterium]|nr:fumarylacetoacetate hydrolase family protein [Planctomycetota bacterium]
MRLMRFGPKGREKPAVFDAERGVALSLEGIVDDVAGDVLGPDGLAGLARVLRAERMNLPRVPDGARIGPCVGRVGKFLCIGLNYADHAAETGAKVPDEPEVFSKATSALSGPFDDVEIPRGAKKVDWEVELGVVIGKHAKYVSKEHALEHVAGYCIVNDLSERAFQLERGRQWDKGKGCDTFGPIGPWLVTKDEVPDPQVLALGLEVDGVRYQNGNTRTMVFTVAHLVSYLSHFMSLHPGDVISTGTPPGVGLGQKPEPIYLRAGQTMRLSIQGLGEQRQRVVQGG